MKRKVKEDLFLPLTWPQREALWKERERYLLLDNKALIERLAEESELHEQARSELGKVKAQLARAQKRIKELEKAHREQDQSSARATIPPRSFRRG